MTTPMPIPHVRPQRPDHEDLHVEVEKPIDRVTFIREQSALFFHEKNLKAKAFDLALVLLGMVFLYIGSH